MMPADEDFYGQWPKCGEIDIMEVLGHQTDCQYATIHYGEPHKLSYYVDDKEIHVVTDWFTAREEEEKKPYPAPFDETAAIMVDYIRVYQN